MKNITSPTRVSTATVMPSKSFMLSISPVACAKSSRYLYKTQSSCWQLQNEAQNDVMITLISFPLTLYRIAAAMQVMLLITSHSTPQVLKLSIRHCPKIVLSHYCPFVSLRFSTLFHPIPFSVFQVGLSKKILPQIL
jgi:hypothetical protein